MGRISTGIGLISGINSKDIIDQLIAIEQQPKTLLQSRKDKVSAQKDAYTGISTSLTDLQSIGRAFERPTTFTASDATSSDENVLTATTSAGAADRVVPVPGRAAGHRPAERHRRLRRPERGRRLGAGQSHDRDGRRRPERPRPSWRTLNGGAGVRRGLFRITDRSGKSAVIDTTSAVTVDDVIKRINTSLDISVRASVSGDRLVLTDGTGATTNDLKVDDLGRRPRRRGPGPRRQRRDAARSPAATSSTSGPNLSLASLNDGRGVRVNAHRRRISSSPPATARPPTSPSAQNVHTLGDVLKAINTAGGSKFKAQLTATGNGIQLVDTTGGGGSISVAAADPDSHAAEDLGLVKTRYRQRRSTGNDLLAGIDTVLVSSLQGGKGLALGHDQRHRPQRQRPNRWT